jgi:hypothetical protein
MGVDERGLQGRPVELDLASGARPLRCVCGIVAHPGDAPSLAEDRSGSRSVAIQGHDAVGDQ